MATVLAVGFVLLDADWLRGWLTARASAALGREVALESATVDWSWTPKVTLHEVTIANAEWGSRPAMVAVDRLEFTVALSELLRGRLVLPEVAASRPDVLLETNQDGVGNWQMSASTDAAGTAMFPIIGALTMED